MAELLGKAVHIGGEPVVAVYGYTAHASCARCEREVHLILYNGETYPRKLHCPFCGKKLVKDLVVVDMDNRQGKYTLAQVTKPYARGRRPLGEREWLERQKSG